MVPNGCNHVVLPLLAATSEVYQGQMLVWPPAGRGALLALVATMGGLPQAAGAMEPHWAPGGEPMWCYLSWVPPVGYTRPKCQCVATGGQGCCAWALLAPPDHHGWLVPYSRYYGAPVVPNGCNHVVLPLLAATSEVYQGQMPVCGHQQAGVHRGTAAPCGHHGCLWWGGRC